MTRRLLDRQKLKRAVEDSKRVLEQARGKPGGKPREAPPWPPGGKRIRPEDHAPTKR